MTKEELKALLEDSLTVEVEESYDCGCKYLVTTLKFDGEEISQSRMYLGSE